MNVRARWLVVPAAIACSAGVWAFHDSQQSEASLRAARTLAMPEPLTIPETILQHARDQSRRVQDMVPLTAEQAALTAERLANASDADAYAVLVMAVLTMVPWTVGAASGRPADDIAGPRAYVLRARACAIRSRTAPTGADDLKDLQDVLACMAGRWAGICSFP